MSSTTRITFFLSGLIPALLAGSFILDVVTPLGVAVCILYLLPLALTVWIGAQRSPFLVAGNSGRLTAIGLFVSPQAFLQLAIINRSMMLVTLAATALLIWSEKKNRASLDREVKIRTHTEEELKLLLKMLERRVDERTQELARSRAEAIRMMEEAEASGRKAQQAEERTRKTADELRDLYNNAPCGYHSLNRERGFIAINHTELNWWGTSVLKRGTT